MGDIKRGRRGLVVGSDTDLRLVEFSIFKLRNNKKEMRGPEREVDLGRKTTQNCYSFFFYAAEKQCSICG